MDHKNNQLNQKTTYSSTTAMTRKNILYLFCIPALVCLLYYPTLSYDYVYWDDDIYILNNDQIKQSPTLSNILSLFQVTDGPAYKPTMYTLWTFVHYFGGLNAFYYHIVSITFYSINIIAVFFFTRELLRCLYFPFSICASYAAFVIALLFLTHPLHVETVAWVVDLKDLLAGTCYFSAGLFYILYRKKSCIKYYLVSILFFLIGLLSKINVATLPVMLIFLDLMVFNISYKQPKAFLGILPFLGLGSGIMLNSVFFVEPSVASHTVLFKTKFLSSMVLVKDYLELLFFPLPSRLCHGYSNKYIEAMGDPQAIVSVIMLLILVVLSIFYLKKLKIMTIAVFWFLLNLAPTSNIVQIGIMKADRYVYLSSFGWAIFVFFIIFSAAKKISKKRPAINYKLTCNVCFLILALLLSGLSRERMEVWKDDISLWEDGFQKSKAITVLNGLAETYFRHNRVDEAINLYKDKYQATGDIRLYQGLANLLFKVGKEMEGKEVCFEALKLWPDDFGMNFQLGIYYSQKKEFVKAQTFLNTAIKSNSIALGPHVVLAQIHMEKGEIKKAMETYLALIERKPYPDALNNLGVIYMKVGNYKNAISCFTLALQNKQDPSIKLNLEKARQQAGTL